MTAAAVIIARQIMHSGNTLLAALELVPAADFYAMNADGYSAAWVTGHLAAVADLFSSWFSGSRLLSPAHHRFFNDSSGPESRVVDPDSWPKAELLERYRTSVIKALRILRTVTDWDAPAPPAVPLMFPTAGSVWERLAMHGEWHSGGLAASMPCFYGTSALNGTPHYFYDPPDAEAA